jgi:hypothetical protein
MTSLRELLLFGCNNLVYLHHILLYQRASIMESILFIQDILEFFFIHIVHVILNHHLAHILLHEVSLQLSYFLLFIKVLYVSSHIALCINEGKTLILQYLNEITR